MTTSPLLHCYELASDGLHKHDLARLPDDGLFRIDDKLTTHLRYVRHDHEVLAPGPWTRGEPDWGTAYVYSDVHGVEWIVPQRFRSGVDEHIEEGEDPHPHYLSMRGRLKQQIRMETSELQALGTAPETAVGRALKAGRLEAFREALLMVDVEGWPDEDEPDLEIDDEDEEES